MAQRGRGSRNKGRIGELELIKRLGELLGLQLARDLSQARDGGCDLRLPGLAIEIKRTEQPRFAQWLDQAKGARREGEWPVVAYRQNHGDWRLIVECTLDEFAELAQWRMR